MPNRDFWGGCTVSLLGCGWLGTAVAQDLLTLGTSVKGSCTRPSKATHLASLGIDSYVLQCLDQLNGENLDTFFNSDVLIVTLPFKRSFEDPLYYVDQIRAIASYIPNSSIKHLIFTSSTGIYDGCSGDVTEDTPLCMDKPRVSALYQVESLLLSIPSVMSCILRLGWLYGESRKLGSFLSGKSRLRSGDSPVNLIHQQDSVMIIRKLLEHPYNGILNAVSDAHPTRQNVYQRAALAVGVDPPRFDMKSLDLLQRRVQNDRLKNTLAYTFIYPDPFEINM